MMKTRLYSMSLIVCILVAIPSSSFFLSDFLTKKITNQNHTKAQLNFALKQDNQVALTYAWSNSKAGSKRWLFLAKKLAKKEGSAAFELANYYQKQQLNNQAIAWYQRAIRLGYSRAITRLAHLYFEQDKLEKVDELLAILPNQHDQTTAAEAIILQVQLATVRGDMPFIEQTLSEFLPLMKSQVQGQVLINDIAKYQVINKQSEQQDKTQVVNSVSYCANSIQLFATNLKHLKQAEQLISQFTHQPLAKFVCFLPVRYIPINLLDCSTNKFKAISCNEVKWQEIAETIDSRFVALLLPEGGANVHLGVLYIDAQDDLDVMTHEISHLLGFVDEYPLAEEHIKCQTVQQEIFSENISVLPSIFQGKRSEARAEVLAQLSWASAIKKSTPILQEINQNKPDNRKLWQLGTPQEFSQEVGVFHSQTCTNAVDKQFNNSEMKIAVKPIAEPTKMQYFSLDLPEAYYENLERNQGAYVMPSFHYNIALAHIKKGNIDKARFWLEESLKLESDIRRKNKILQGAF